MRTPIGRKLLEMTRTLLTLGFARPPGPPVEPIAREEEPLQPPPERHLSEQRHDGAEDRERAEGREPR